MRTPPGDDHGMWINPRNSNYLFESNDGGANVSVDGGRTWSTQYNQPTAEIYQVAVDNQYPYRVYGARSEERRVGKESTSTRRPSGSEKDISAPLTRW